MTHKITQDSYITVDSLKKYFYSRKQAVFSGKNQKIIKAVNDVSFTINKGEIFGIVGESGCGKTTLGRSLLRLTEPTAGDIDVDGINLLALDKEEMRLMRKRLQIIFQDPYSSLNPRLTVRELIQAPLDVFDVGLSAAEKKQRVVSIMEKVGLSAEFMRKYPHEFSGGQRQRIVIARALILEPEFIVCDEPVSALDVSVRAQVLNLLKQLQKEMELTLLFITHDLSVVRFLCDTVAVMYLGTIVEIGSKQAVFSQQLHPYTEVLFSSIPVPDPEVKVDRIMLKGEVPNSYEIPTGCPFHPRCSKAMEICREERPVLQSISSEHQVACHLYRIESESINIEKKS